MFFIGIDPGAQGFLAAINTENGEVAFVQYNTKAYADFLEEVSLKQCFCVVEHVWSSPQMGVRSAFSFGEKLGEIHGMLDALGIPYQMVIPQKWKRYFGCTSDKNSSIVTAQRLFPKVDFRATDRCKKPHDGKAEAALMALYAQRIYKE